MTPSADFGGMEKLVEVLLSHDVKDVQVIEEMMLLEAMFAPSEAKVTPSETKEEQKELALEVEQVVGLEEHTDQKPD